jgi:hypothetical protein
MLDIILLGLNHKTAPVELRERLAFSKDETAAAMEAFQNQNLRTFRLPILKMLFTSMMAMKRCATFSGLHQA